MKILLTKPTHERDIKYMDKELKQRIGENYEIIVPRSYDEESLLTVCEECEVFIGPFFTERMLIKAKKLRLIQIPWTGVENLDFELASKYNVTIANCHSTANAVAEFAVALTLDLYKKIAFHDTKMRLGDWNRTWKDQSLRSKMIQNSKVCILGYGSIGSRIGTMMSAFGADVSAVTLHGRPLEGIKKSYSFDTIKEALSLADAVIIALPFTEMTRNLLGSELLTCMKESAVLINIGRTAIIDEQVLYERLLEKKLAGYASDVWWQEPSKDRKEISVSSKCPFEELENVILSPHRAIYVGEGELDYLEDVIENIVRIDRNEGLNHIVDLQKQY